MSNVDSVLLKFEQASEQVSGNTKRVVGFVKVRRLADLITAVDLESNPRSSKTGTITESILESLDRTSETFPFKTKGILVGSSSYRPLERRRYELTFVEPALEGILDGGHNALSLGIYMLRVAGVSNNVLSRIKLWSDFKGVWAEHLDKVERIVADTGHSEELDTLVPVELLVPSDAEDPASVDDFSASLLEICAARNNNAQLKAETKANQSGYFETLKEVLSPEISEAVEWKTNDGGRIKVADIVALSWIPLSLLNLPKDEDGQPVEPPVPQNIYRSKGDCVARFERLMSSPEVTSAEDGQYKRNLKSPQVRSALDVTAKIVELYDYVYANFPSAYNANDGKLMRITVVKKMNRSDRKKYTKYTQKPVDKAIPEGFVIPLVYGLQALLKVDEAGCVKWDTDPDDFLKSNLTSLVGDHKSAIALLDYDSQKVGKSPEAYRMAHSAYENEFFRSLLKKA